MTQPTTDASLPSILVVDDDSIYRTQLVRALTTRRYEAYAASNREEAMIIARRNEPERAVVDLRMPDANGLDVVSELMTIDPHIQIIVLTGYGSIATAVEAVRRGAHDYLTKPVDVDQILQTFDKEGGGQVPESTPSLARVEWEHIQRILSDCGNNISEAARRLGIHRRSLQRKLQKYPPLD
jgi:two-component system, response regulator RegA